MTGGREGGGEGTWEETRGRGGGERGMTNCNCNQLPTHVRRTNEINAVSNEINAVSVPPTTDLLREERGGVM